MNLIFFANGPGELKERAIPLAYLLKSEISQCKIFLILTPCQFSAGTEYKVAKDSSIFDEVFKLKNPFYPLNRFFRKKIDGVFHLGGDILYPEFFSVILGARLFSYGMFFISNKANKYLIPFPSSFYSVFRKSIPLSKTFFVGELSFNKSIYSHYFKKNNIWKIGLFPGSRKLQFEHIFPFFIKILEGLYNNGYRIKPILFLSPFVSLSFLRKVLSDGPTYKVLDYSLGKLYNKEHFYYIISEKGIKIEIEDNSSKVEDLDFAITTPGTSTLTLSHSSIPMIVVTPLNKVDIIPLNGIINFINYIPYLGAIIKRELVFNYLSRKNFLALPNIIEDRKIVDELKEVLNSSMVEERIKFLFSSSKDLYRTKKELIEFRQKYKLRKSKILEAVKEDE